jgi:MFS family permease
VILYTRLVAIPFSILMPLMPTPELSIAFNGVFYLTLGMTGPMLNAVMLAVSPNALRGQIMTLYLFIYTVVGVGMGPYVTGATTDHIFTSPDDLKWSIVLLHVVFLPLSLAVTWLGLKAFRTEVARLNALDSKT